MRRSRVARLNDLELIAAACVAVEMDSNALGERLLKVPAHTVYRWRTELRTMDWPTRQLLRAIVLHPELCGDLDKLPGPYEPEPA